MPSYRKRVLNQTQVEVPLAPLHGGQPMRRAPASAVHSDGDRWPAGGRRIAGAVGLSLAKKFHVPDTAGGGASQIYPDKDTERVVLRVPSQPLVPGCFLRASVVALPSGQTEGPLLTGFHPTTGPGGLVKIVVTYTNSGGNVAVTKKIPLAASAAQYAAQPSGSAAAWSNLIEEHTDFFRPADLNVIANLAAWSKDVTYTVVVSYIGSPRVIDCVVHEQPLALAFDLSAGGWPVPLHSKGNGFDLGSLPGPVPVTKKSASDPGGGGEIVVDAAARACQEWGPILWSATAWDEGNQTVTDTEAVFKSVTGTTYTEIVAATTTVYSTSTAGWSASSGANARRVQDAEVVKILRDRDNVVPVQVHIYCAMSTAVSSPTATVQFATADYSIAEVAVPAGTSYAWRSAYGKLRCGLGAQDPTVLQVRAKCSTASGSPAFRWRYAVVTFADI